MEKKINILYIITQLELGGAQQQLLSLIRQLDREKFRPFLFTADKGVLVPEAEEISGLTIRRSPNLKRQIDPIADIRAFFEAYFFIRKNRIDIVHTHSSKAGVLGRLSAALAGVGRIIHTVHGWSFNRWQPALFRGVCVWLERACAALSTKIIVVCLADRQTGLTNRIGRPGQYALIRYGICLPEFAVAYPRQRESLGLKNQELAVCMVACLKPQKAPRDFIRLAGMPANKGIKFFLAGDGVLRPEIERQINRMGADGNITLLGWRRPISALLSAMDVFVLTSLWEGLPVAVLEAMAAAKPVVVTDTGGVSEVIRDGETGFLVAPGDMEAMNEKLDLLLNQPELRRNIGWRARESLSADFSREAMAGRVQGLYQASALKSYRDDN